MFLKCSTRRKNGKEHRSWSIVESRRYGNGKVAQRHVLYLGEINDNQRLAWEKTISVFDQRQGDQRQIALFPADRTPPGRGSRECAGALGFTSLGTTAAMGRVLVGR